MSVAFHSRKDLGLVPPDLNHLGHRIGKIRGVVVHWFDDAPEPQHPSETWRELQRNAMSGNNVNHTVYGDIEYNAGACESIAHPGNGSLFAGRPNEFNGGHALSHDGVANHTTLGICVLGNKFTRAVQAALESYVYLAYLGRDTSVPFVLEGHGELVNVGGIATACPGTALPWVRSFRAAHGFVTL